MSSDLADLYRLGDSSELVELGLDEAMERAIVLIEWPDRLPAEMVPNNALAIDFVPVAETRVLNIASSSDRWHGILAEFSNV